MFIYFYRVTRDHNGRHGVLLFYLFNQYLLLLLYIPQQGHCIAVESSINVIVRALLWLFIFPSTFLLIYESV